jgi:hypothetical protein
MTEDKKTPQNEPKKRTRRKPLSLHPMTEEEALRRVLGAGPDPDKRGKKSTRKSAKKGE